MCIGQRTFGESFGRFEGNEREWAVQEKGSNYNREELSRFQALPRNPSHARQEIRSLSAMLVRGTWRHRRLVAPKYKLVTGSFSGRRKSRILTTRGRGTARMAKSNAGRSWPTQHLFTAAGSHIAWPSGISLPRSSGFSACWWSSTFDRTVQFWRRASEILAPTGGVSLEPREQKVRGRWGHQPSHQYASRVFGRRGFPEGPRVKSPGGSLWAISCNPSNVFWKSRYHPVMQQPP